MPQPSEHAPDWAYIASKRIEGAEAAVVCWSYTVKACTQYIDRRHLCAGSGVCGYCAQTWSHDEFGAQKSFVEDGQQVLYVVLRMHCCSERQEEEAVGEGN